MPNSCCPHRRGVGNKMIGVMLTIMTLCNAIFGWLFSAVGDRYKWHKQICCGSFFCFVLFTSVLAFNRKLWFTAVFGIAAQCAWGPVIPMLDNVTVNLVQETSEDYSKQRPDLQRDQRRGDWPGGHTDERAGAARFLLEKTARRCECIQNP